jgi:ABC-type lipoprotein export system ATPase subunit
MTEPQRLVLENVSKRYAGPDGADGPVILRDVSLTLAAGESLAVVGPSGCGKSTLLNLMGTLDRPTSGRVLLDGEDIAALDDDALAAVRCSRIGFVFQLHHLLPQCSALENVLVPTLAGPKRDGEADALRAVNLLERMDLGTRMDYRPGQLSGGERQRVAVARALINQPTMILADEPTGSLDRAAADDLAQLLVDACREEHATLVVVTHAAGLASRMGRAMELKDGTLAPVR